MSEQKAKRVKLNNIHRNTAFAPEDHATLDSKEDWVKARKIVLVEEKELRYSMICFFCAYQRGELLQYKNA